MTLAHVVETGRLRLAGLQSADVLWLPGNHRQQELTLTQHILPPTLRSPKPDAQAGASTAPRGRATKARLRGHSGTLAVAADQTVTGALASQEPIERTRSVPSCEEFPRNSRVCVHLLRGKRG